MHERVGAAHQRVHLVVGQVAGELHGVAAGGVAHALALAAVDAGQHEPVLEALAAQPAKRLDEAQQVLLRPQVADGEQVGTVGSGKGASPIGSDGALGMIRTRASSTS